MSNDRKHHGTDDPDLDRRLQDGFAFLQACEDDSINPQTHLGRASDNPVGSDYLDAADVVGEE